MSEQGQVEMGRNFRDELDKLTSERDALFAKLAKAHGVAFRLMEISRNPTPSVMSIRDCAAILQSL